MKERIIIADDDHAIVDGCNQVLSKLGYEVTCAYSGLEALEFLEKYEYDLVLLDLKLPDINGLDLLRELRKRDSVVPVVMITAYGTIQNAVEAMRLGADDFLPKPFEPDELRLVVRRSLRARRLAKENLYLKEELRKKEGAVEVIGTSRALSSLLKQVERVAPLDTTVLITGESGTGKGLIARKIHQLSRRSGFPFVSVDCSTLVPSLFESELFGHVKGAFTGATTHKIGKFEMADGGTLFLDEIANINLELQAKLLKAVEEKEISRVGSQRITKVDVRIVAATNRDLQKAVSKGEFREDLYFRLNVVALTTPPLRERKEDIPLLVEYFLKRFALNHGRKLLKVAPDVLSRLKEYEWPGNVRELENAVERLAIFAQDDVITLEDLAMARVPQAGLAPRLHYSGKLPLEEVEKAHILGVLKDTNGNRTEAAKILGIDRKTLRLKLQKWGIHEL